ncbi:MAG: hypothetical protein JW712_04320 [Dehalococcoidales bacterium]|nr:hypothetical protein [Dehalococcoidales bacterium]
MITKPAADIWNPKTVRASMGALFHVRHEYFPSFEAYALRFSGHVKFMFMPDGEALPEDCHPCPLFSLVFGNEAAGLDSRFESLGQSVKIPLSGSIDSFNLAVAVGLGAYVFARKNRLVQGDDN